MRILVVFLFCACAIFCVPLAANEANITSLKSSLEKAYVNNPTLRVARAELLEVQERLPQAYAGWKPSISSSASLTATDVEGSNFGSSSGATTKDIGLSLEQPLFRGGSTFAEVSAAKHIIQSQKNFLNAREQEIFLQVVTAYMDVFRDQDLLELSLNNEDVIKKELEATQERFDVGELTKTDVSQAEARLANATSDVITAQGNLASSRAVFEQLTKMKADNFTEPEIVLDIPANIDLAIVTAEASNPLLLSYASAHKAAEEDINDVFGELLPQVNFFSSWNKSYDPSPGIIDQQTTSSIGLSATVPLYQAGATRSRIRQAKKTANKKYLEILELKENIKQEVVTRWAEWQAAKAEIRSREKQVGAAETARDGVRYEADFGSRSVLDVLDSDQEFLDAQVALVMAYRNEVVARFGLSEKLGLLTPKSLGLGVNKFDGSENLNDITRSIFDMHVDRVGTDQ